MTMSDGIGTALRNYRARELRNAVRAARASQAAATQKDTVTAFSAYFCVREGCVFLRSVVRLFGRASGHFSILIFHLIPHERSEIHCNYLVASHA